MCGRDQDLPLGAPSSVWREGRPVPQVADVDAADQGWQWLMESDMLILKLLGDEAWQVEVEW